MRMRAAASGAGIVTRLFFFMSDCSCDAPQESAEDPSCL